MTKLKLEPKKSDRIKDFLDEEERIRELMETHRSPLNIVFPEAVRENVEKFQKVIEERKVSARIFYAHKANRSKALVKAVSDSGAGIDVASLDELENALDSGVQPSDIEATGPKNQRFLDRLVEENITVNIDNFEELEYLGGFNSEVEVMVRISGFSPQDRDSISKDSRFGISINRKEELLETLKSVDSINFRGFSFHLSTSDIRKRRIAISNILDLHQEFAAEGLNPKILNIGGGFRTNYIKNREQWEEYISAIKDNVAKGGTLTWKDETYGFYRDEDSIKGSNSFYDYFNSPSKHEYLSEILDSTIPGYDRSFADLLNDFMLELYIEPGRALLDQAGLTLTDVIFTKKSVKGNKLVGVDANKFSLYSTEQEMMLDPELITDKNGEPGSAFIAGNLCLESDLIYKHKTFFDQMPQKGDILAFVNTAAYNMDFAENKAIHHQTAQKLIVCKEGDYYKINNDIV